MYRGIFENDLAVVTFLCKDFWTEVYGKQVPVRVSERVCVM